MMICNALPSDYPLFKTWSSECSATGKRSTTLTLTGCLITPPAFTNSSNKSIQMSFSSAHYPIPGRPDRPESQIIILKYLNLRGIPVPRAARRRWRRQALHREQLSQAEWIATDGASSDSTPTAVAESV